MKEILKIQNLHKRFPINKTLSVHAVNGVSFSIAAGETLGLVGESGCGKTTVGRCAVRLIDPTIGKIIVMGDDLTGLSGKELGRLRSKVQISFQDPYGALNPRKVVRQIVGDPLILEGRLAKDGRSKRVREVLKMVELTDGYLEKYPVQLTQGEQQRIGVARALATNPQIIVLDEPTSLLDIRSRGETIVLLKRLQKELGIAYLFISHDLVVISQLSHRIAVMYLGRIVEQGSTKAVFESPMHPYTRALFAATLFPDPDQKRGEFLLKGEVPSPVNLPDNRCNLAPRCPLGKSYCYESLPKLEEVDDGRFVACHEVHHPRDKKATNVKL